MIPDPDHVALVKTSLGIVLQHIGAGAPSQDASTTGNYENQLCPSSGYLNSMVDDWQHFDDYSSGEAQQAAK